MMQMGGRSFFKPTSYLNIASSLSSTQTVSLPHFILCRSYLPSSSTGAATALGVSLSPPMAQGGAGEGTRPPPLYLPTAENRDAYKTVVVERKIVVRPPAEPVKDANTIELEV